MRDIGKNIRSLREGKDLTQEQLAERLFVTRQTVSNYETGRSRPDVEMLLKIAEVLDVDANTVIYGKEVSPDQRLERRALAVAFLLTLVLGTLWFVLTPAAQEHRRTYFNTLPLIMLHIFVLSGLLLTVGWTLMQSFHVFLGAKRLKEAKSRLFRRFLLVALAIWLLLVLPPLTDMLRLEIVRWQWLQTHDSYSSVDHALPGILYNMVWNPVSAGLVWYIRKYCALFFAVGIGLWLTGFPKRNSHL